jgi:hypothetical protein
LQGYIYTLQHYGSQTSLLCDPTHQREWNRFGLLHSALKKCNARRVFYKWVRLLRICLVAFLGCRYMRQCIIQPAVIIRELGKPVCCLCAGHLCRM